MRLTAILLSTLCCTSLSFAEDWPQFRGPGGLGVSREKGTPVTWSATKNVAWKVELPGAGTSSPVTFGDRIFLTCYNGYNVPGMAGSMDSLKQELLCLARKDGKLLWRKAIKTKLPEQGRIREEHGYASSTPAVDATGIYTFFGKSGVFAFDHQGKQLWQADVGSQLNGWGSATSVVLFHDLVIVNASVESESLVALNKKTGKEAWRARGIKESWNTPLLVSAGQGKTELVVAIHGKLLGFDPASGQALWSSATDIGWYMVPSLVASDGVVYAIGGRNGGGALAVRTGGKGDVTRSHRLWTSKKGSNVPSPIYHAGHLYYMSDGLETAYCADAKTGRLVYEQRIPRAGGIYASPVLADGKIYYFSRSGKGLVVAAKPAFELLATNELGDRSAVNSSPAISNGQILLRSNRFLYCLGGK